MKKSLSIITFLLILATLLPSCTPALTEAEEPEVSEEKHVTESTEERIMQKYDPAEDDVINVLMIGNSGCYYYVEELYGIAKAAGVDMKVCNVYYSGCTLKQHWTWWKLNENHYQYFETDARGRRKVLDNTGLRTCLIQNNWDVISFQQSVYSKRGDLANAKSSYYPYLTDLYDFVSGEFPKSKFYWHHTWSYQVGHDRNGISVDTPEKQAELAGWCKEFAMEVCKDYPMTRIPCGDAWQYARQNPIVGDVLCNRGEMSDTYHDGDVGGGQYLNGCVWFETITGKSCIGNTWRPDNYELSEAKIVILQEAAHRAVAELRG